MNRDEFMKRVEYLISDLPEEETRDALDYYRDYLEEAGDAAEEAMREFGSPERIASIIRTDIQGNLADGGEFTDTGYTDERFREPNCQLARREQDPNADDARKQDSGRDAYAGGSREAPHGAEGSYRQDERQDGYGGYAYGSGGGETGRPGSPGRSGSGSAAKVLWIILAVIGVITVLPALLGFAGGAFGILTAIVVLLLVFVLLTAILTLVFLVSGVAVAAAGIAAAFVDPLDGVACVGVGLVMLAVGLVGVVLSVLLYGKLLPWLFRGAIDGLNGMLHRKERTA